MNNDSLKKIIIADDHIMVCKGLAAFLRGYHYDVLEQLHSFADLKSVLAQLDTAVLQQLCVVSDCRMDGGEPLQFLLECKRAYPGLAVIFLSGLESGLLFDQLLEAGAAGIVSKKGEPEELVAAIEQLNDAEVYVSPSIERHLASKPSALSKVEFQVLEQVVNGLSNNECAQLLHKSPSTINTHRTNIMRKLEVNSVVQLVHYCRKNGLFDS